MIFKIAFIPLIFFFLQKFSTTSDIEDIHPEIPASEAETANRQQMKAIPKTQHLQIRVRFFTIILCVW